MRLIAIIICLIVQTMTTAAQDFVDRRVIIERLLERDYDFLEATFSRVHAEFQATGEDRYLDHAFETFRRTDQETQAALNGWVDHAPRSAYALTARGVHKLRIGWHRRSAPRSLRQKDPIYAAAISEAITDFEHAHDIDPRFPMPHAFLIQAAMATGDHNSLGHFYRRAMNEAPNSDTIRWRYFFSLTPQWYGDDLITPTIARGEIIIANFLARLSPSRSAGAPAGFWDYIRGETATYYGKRKKAERLLRAATKNPSVRWWMLRRHSNVLDVLDRHDEALMVLDEAMKRAPQNIVLLEDKADILRETKQYEKALHTLNNALFYDPVNPKLLAEIAIIHKILGKALSKDDPQLAHQQFERSLHTVNRAMQHGPNLEVVRRTRGRLFLYDLKKARSALEEYTFLTKNFPRNPKYKYGYARSLMLNWDCGSVDAFREYLAICTSKRRNKRCLDGQIKASERSLRSIQEQNYCPGARSGKSD